MAKLYLPEGGEEPRFLCRRCHRLAYQSQGEDRADRLYRKAWRIRERLGGSGGLYDPLPARPTGMHAQTYLRLTEEYNKVLDEASALEDAWLTAFTARLEQTEWYSRGRQ